MYRSLLFAQLAVVVALTAFHLAAIEFDLYWRFLWLDVVAHILGGMWVGLLFIHVRVWFGFVPTIAWGILGALIFGVVWEVFEVVAGIPREASYALDTSIDLLMDAVGGASGAFIARAITRTQYSKEE